VKRSEVCKFAKSVGVHIAENYSEPYSKDYSFRIAFHPYMGNDSLKLLGYVLAYASRKEAGDKSN
jgi:hypothetical protein